MSVTLYCLATLASMLYFSWGYQVSEDPDVAFHELAVMGIMAVAWPLAWPYVLYCALTAKGDE